MKALVNRVVLVARTSEEKDWPDFLEWWQNAMADCRCPGALLPPS